MTVSLRRPDLQMKIYRTFRTLESHAGFTNRVLPWWFLVRRREGAFSKCMVWRLLRKLPIFSFPNSSPNSSSGFLVWRVLTLKPDNGCPRIPIGCSTAKRLHGIGWDLGMRTHKLIIATELQRGRIAFYWESTFRWTQTVSPVNQSLMFSWSLHLRRIQQGPS